MFIFEVDSIDLFFLVFGRIWEAVWENHHFPQAGILYVSVYIFKLKTSVSPFFAQESEASDRDIAHFKALWPLRPSSELVSYVSWSSAFCLQNGELKQQSVVQLDLLSQVLLSYYNYSRNCQLIQFLSWKFMH